jgi:phosphoribosylanthranilate isomerase
MSHTARNPIPKESEKPLKIKICGLTRPRNVEEVSALDPDFAGYIFYPGSVRYVGDQPDPALFRIPGEATARVGVFVDASTSRVRMLFEKCLLDLVQLHGSESPAYCRELVDAGIPVIKVVHAGDPEIAQRIAEGAQGEKGGAGFMDPYSGVVHYLLFDSGKSGSGGTGQSFDWNLFSELRIPFPFLLGGGIGPEDAPRIGALNHASLFGVDLNSRFERSPGIKDTGLLGPFIKELRHATQGK